MEKMSKSRGNVVTVDEVVHGVQSLREGWELRDANNETVDPNKVGAWVDLNGNYFTAVRNGKQPLWLCRIEEPVPPLIRGCVQHTQQIGYWQRMLALHEVS